MTFPGMRLAKSKALEDGHTVLVTDATGDRVLLIGTRPLPEHRAEARMIVRSGLADILAWLGQPVEPPTGDRLYARMRGIPLPRPLPTSSRAFPVDSHAFRYLKAAPVDWAAVLASPDAIPEVTAVPEAFTLTAQRFGGREVLPLEFFAAPDQIVMAVQRAMRNLFRSAGDALRASGYVADITEGHPVPELSVELRFKAWPAVAGVTTDERRPA